MWTFMETTGEISSQEMSICHASNIRSKDEVVYLQRTFGNTMKQYLL